MVLPLEQIFITTFLFGTLDFCQICVYEVPNIARVECGAMIVNSLLEEFRHFKSIL
jgi:hypothetical protein